VPCDWDYLRGANGWIEEGYVRLNVARVMAFTWYSKSQQIVSKNIFVCECDWFWGGGISWDSSVGKVYI